MSNQVTGDLLCLILDINPLQWSRSSSTSSNDDSDSLSLDLALDQLIVFANSHLALRHENQIQITIAGLGISKQVFPPTVTTSDKDQGEKETEEEEDDNMYQPFRIVDQNFVKGVKQLMREMPTESKKGLNLVGALSMALCYINRLSQSSLSSTSNSNNSTVGGVGGNPTSTTSLITSSTPGGGTTQMLKAQPRILIVSVTKDESSQYVPIMNCIFTAQKNNIQIDVIKVFGPDAVFLQQACHLTGGAYYRLEKRQALLQYLMMGFLAGPQARKHLYQPRQDQVDLRAACFCHRKIVDIGFVCSVCLSIFCSPLPVCLTCRTKFPMSTLKRLGFGASSGSSATRSRPGGTGGASGGGGPMKKRKVGTTGITNGTTSQGKNGISGGNGGTTTTTTTTNGAVTPTTTTPTTNS